MTQLPGVVVLPSIGTDASVSQRHEVNPALAINLLQEIQSMVLVWQRQLRQVVKALRSLQTQGPMVDGWLESLSEPAAGTLATDSTVLRHGDADALMRYVESLDRPPAHSTANRQANKQANEQLVASADATSTKYRLCQLDENGQLRSHTCPPQQLGVVSMAIARHQKYKQLLAQKQALESKLQRAVDQLTGVRADLRNE